MRKLILGAVLFSTIQIQAQPLKMDWVNKVGAKQFPASKKIYKVNAVSDTTKVITKKIQSAIDECAKNGQEEDEIFDKHLT